MTDDDSQRPVQPRKGKGKGANQFTTDRLSWERYAQALDLRSKGYQYRQIAAEMGIDVKTAFDFVKRGQRAIVAEPAKRVIKMEEQRLDDALRRVMDILDGDHVMVQQGRVVLHDGQPLPDQELILKAIDRLVKISESRRKLLGLDAAQKVDVEAGVKYEVVGIDPGDLT